MHLKGMFCKLAKENSCNSNKLQVPKRVEKKKASHEENRAPLRRIEGLEDVVLDARFRHYAGFPDDYSEVYEFLASGEYNMNFLVKVEGRQNPVVLRVECGSQLGLENQIEYEVNALMCLSPSGRTPSVIAADADRKHCKHGVLLETFKKGHHLDYNSDHDLLCAAHVLADIHSLTPPINCRLQLASNPWLTMLAECQVMASVYLNSQYANRSVSSRIEKMLDKAEEITKHTNPEIPHLSIVNTEVNNTNFLIGDIKDSYLVDWEKPLISDPAQDIGHFLADTTTFWKTDVIFNEEKKKQFVDRYIEAIDNRFYDEKLAQRSLDMAKFTCLRGVTWCAMAYVQYQDDSKELRDEFTRKKLDDYLDTGFLDNIYLG